MRVVFEEYWKDVREGLEAMGARLPPPDLDALVAELRERGVSETRLCTRWMHVLDVEAAGGTLPGTDALTRTPYMHFGAYVMSGFLNRVDPRCPETTAPCGFRRARDEHRTHDSGHERR